MGPKVKIWVLILLASLACRAFSQQFTNTQFIKTDASGGIFRKDQILSFELNAPGWFRILLNEREMYRGRGPAYQELGVPHGEERGFNIRAEYFSAGGELAESLSWYIFIDKKAPPFPDLEFRNTAEGLRLIQTGAELTAKTRAIADIGGNLVFFSDLGDHLNLVTDFYPSDSFPALVWAEELSGNHSDFSNEFFDLSFVRIENPVSGEWLNQQILIISGIEERSIYWTDDGTHPLEAGGTGKLYRWPVRIAREGRVEIRIAWRESDGRIREDMVDYTVMPNKGTTGSTEGILDLLGKAEETEILSPVTLQVPDEWWWSIGNVPRQQLEGKVSLRPERLIQRTVALHLSPSAGAWQLGTGIYRFAYFLDGGSSGIHNDVRTPVRREPVRESSLHPIEDSDAFPPLKLFSAGRSRVIVWPEVRGHIYYSWGGIWREGTGPLPIPLQGGNLRWFVLDREMRDDEDLPGPYNVSIGAQPGIRETPGGRIAYRRYDTEKGWEYASSLFDFTPGILWNLDVCDGENLVWAFISTGGRILEQQRRSRLSPPVPGIEGFPTAGWARGPVNLSVVPGEEDYSGIIEATMRYASGKEERVHGINSLVLASAQGELAEVTVEAYFKDTQGNRGPGITRHFTLDPKTIYVSSEPLVAPPGVSGEPLRRGDFYNPFASLEEALVFANTQGLVDIRVAGKLELQRPLTVNRSIHIESGWNWEGGRAEATIALGNDFIWNLRANSSLKLSFLRLERPRGTETLIRAGRGSKVEITGTDIINQGPLLTMESGVCVINESQFQVRIPGEQRIAVFSAEGSSVGINDSRFELEGNYNLIFDIRGGSFFAKDSGFFSSRGRTASLILLSGTRANLNNLILHANAMDYASSLEVQGSDLLLSGGNISVTARDTNAILLERCAAIILGTRIFVNGAFSARALEIRGAFPLIQDSHFDSAGNAARSEVFSAVDAPKAGSISGNVFSGFTHIWGPGWPMERLSVFNQDYASAEKPNTAALRP